MSSPDIQLLALFSDRETYEKYRKVVNQDSICLSETGQILADYEAFYKAFPSYKSICFDQFRTYSRVVRHPTWKADKADAYDAILARVELLAAGKVGLEILDHFQRIEAVNKIVEIANDVAEGRSDDLSPIADIVDKIKRETIATEDLSHMFGPTDLTKILEARIRSGGLEWRCDILNQSAGPLHSGDFVVMMARPEAGKTSWLCSELTHMVKYLPKERDAVIFNPEEGGGRVFLRLVSSALDEDIITIASDEVSAKARYESEVGRLDRVKVVEPTGGISTRDIERVLEKGNYGLVAINVIDKIKLPKAYHAEKEVDRYRNLALWLRECANKYATPILAVAQADAAAEGQRYLTMGMIYGSKTGVQGEADLLIGMGMDPSVTNRRYLSLLKNKLPGGPKTNPLLKHGKLEVKFNEATGRYSDV
jgi:replicative DNA helicase